jgi:hypothetical protein
MTESTAWPMAGRARDDHLARELWDISARLTGLPI